MKIGRGSKAPAMNIQITIRLFFLQRFLSGVVSTTAVIKVHLLSGCLFIVCLCFSFLFCVMHFCDWLGVLVFVIELDGILHKSAMICLYFCASLTRLLLAIITTSGSFTDSICIFIIYDMKMMGWRLPHGIDM